MRFACLILVITAFSPLNAQSFILNQFFQPSISLNGEYVHDISVDGDQWSMGKYNANIIIPVKSKLGLEMDWKKLFQIKKLGDLKDVAKVNAHQIFWTLRPQVISLNYQTDSLNNSPFRQPFHHTYGLQTGVTGLHLIKKARILFYTVNVGVQEDFQSINQLKPYANGVIGVVNFNNILYYWYYGLSVSASEGQFWPVVPIPFLGVDLHLAKKVWWNITLPVQTRLEWKVKKRVKLDAVASLATYGTGFGQELPTGFERQYASGIQFRTGLAINLKTKRGTKFYLEGGYMPFRSFSFNLGKPLARQIDAPSLEPAPYVAISMFYGFKKALLGSTVESFLNF